MMCFHSRQGTNMPILREPYQTNRFFDKPIPFLLCIHLQHVHHLRVAKQPWSPAYCRSCFSALTRTKFVWKPPQALTTATFSDSKLETRGDLSGKSWWPRREKAETNSRPLNGHWVHSWCAPDGYTSVVPCCNPPGETKNEFVLPLLAQDGSTQMLLLFNPTLLPKLSWGINVH